MHRKMVVLYEGEKVLGEVELSPQDGGVVAEEVKEIRVSHYSLPSERCSPLAVLHTVNSAGMCFKLESSAKNRDSPLSHLHATCLRDNKTAVTFIGGREIHLVAMNSRKHEEQTPCFWGYSVASSLYNSCLVMLNLRCLGIVFDLDETLIVANTMRSFEDKMGALQRKINSESDPHRLSGLLAEFKRYQDDKDMLKQYVDTDQVIENNKIIKSQCEVVPALSEAHPSIVRPIVRLQDRNVILTRINPQIRDTSVLVRLRPAWEDLRTYLIAKGRKRFEVFVCTMAEKDYALEMWRLLDPEYLLISSRDLLERVVSVKGTRKSLFNVFQTGNCHPKMALVIDDRLKVWEDKDQPRVHVVPAFAPYYAPQAEAQSSVSVLCVVRNVACNVRGSFFKEFDDVLLQQISGVACGDDIKDVPASPDVSNYLITEGDSSSSNGNKDSLGFDGMADAEVERRLKEAISASSASPPALNLDPRISAVLQYTRPSSSFIVPPPTIHVPAVSSPSPLLHQVSTPLKSPLPQLGQPETTVHSSPVREEGEVPESELDPDTRRRLLILQHGQDMRGQNPPSKTQSPAQPPVQVSVQGILPLCWIPVEEETGPRKMNQIAHSTDSIPNDNIQVLHQTFLHRNGSSILPGKVHESSRPLKEAIPREERSRLNQSLSTLQSSIANNDPDLESGQIDPYMETVTQALEDIALQCGTKVEFKQTLVSSANLQFFVEVLFAGERVGKGFGKTRREALHQAAEGSLLNLADKYFLQRRPDSGYMPGDGSRRASPKMNGFNTNANSLEYHSSPREGGKPLSTSITQSKILDPRIKVSKKQVGPVAALSELCAVEGLSVEFETQHQFSANPSQKIEVCAQVEINGQIMGKGLGLTSDEAKSQAAEEAIGAVKSMLGQFSCNRLRVCSPRSMQVPNKRVKQEMSRVPHRIYRR